MLWESPTDAPAKKSSIGGNKKNYEVLKELAIDGQQRLTALLAVLYGVPVRDSSYKERAIRIAYDPIAKTFKNADASTDRDPRYVKSVADVFFAKRENKLSTYRKEFVRALNESNEWKGEPVLTDEDEDAIEQGLNNLLGLAVVCQDVVNGILSDRREGFPQAVDCRGLRRERKSLPCHSILTHG